MRMWSPLESDRLARLLDALPLRWTVAGRLLLLAARFIWIIPALRL
jgi:hypothetical protein